MERFSVVGQRAAAATKTVVGITGATTVRPRVYEVVYGSEAAPADQAMYVSLRRSTAAGTSTSVTPQNFDSEGPSAVSTAGENHTAEPTYTSGADMLNFPINQQATFRWVVPVEEGIMVPNTASNGLGLQIISISGGTPNVTAQLSFEE